jgi:uncharacterized protein (DUF488 family)
MDVYTIGFTKKSAQTFFELIQRSSVQRVIDVRLNNVSQLAGFSKRDDLKYFLSEICEVDYIHCPELAPEQAMLDAYKKRGGGWDEYELRFLELMKEREIEKVLSKDILDRGCLLCSEDKPHHCHRRLVAEYLKEHWGDVEIVHLF